MRWLFSILLIATCGCSTTPKVDVHPPDRKGEWHGYLNAAQSALGMKLEGDSEAHFVPATHYPNGKAAIIMPMSGGQLVGGWTAGNRDGCKTVMATYPDGRLGPRTGRHEAGRVILHTNGVHGEGDQERRLKEVGLW